MNAAVWGGVFRGCISQAKSTVWASLRQTLTTYDSAGERRVFHDTHMSSFVELPILCIRAERWLCRLGLLKPQ